MFMKTVALELAAYNITVNAIAPGYIVTNIGEGHALNPVEQKAVAKSIPMHRIGYPRICMDSRFISPPAHPTT